MSLSSTQRVVALSVLTTVVVAILVYFVTDDHFLLVIVAVMLGVVIALQIDGLARFERRSTREDKYSRIMAAAESVPWLPSVLEEIANAAHNIVSRPKLQPLIDVAEKELERARQHLTTLQNGQFRADAADSTILFDQTDRAERIMLATFLQRFDLQWWSSELGRHYWSVNQQASERGVEIRRIFIYDEWTPELEQIVREQREAGIEVMAVAGERVPRDCRVAMVIWDDRLVYQGELNSDGETINVIYSVSKADVDARLSQFNRIRSVAKPASEMLQGPVP